MSEPFNSPRHTLPEKYKSLGQDAKDLSIGWAQDFIQAPSIHVLFKGYDGTKNQLQKLLDELSDYGLVQKGRLIKGDPKIDYTSLPVFIPDSSGVRYRLEPRYLHFLYKNELKLSESKIAEEMQLRFGAKWEELIK